MESIAKGKSYKPEFGSLTMSLMKVKKGFKKLPKHSG